jgi:hypothetical protein
MAFIIANHDDAANPPTPVPALDPVVPTPIGAITNPLVVSTDR